MVLEPKVLQLDLSSKDPKRKSLSRNEFGLNIYESEECHIVGSLPSVPIVLNLACKILAQVSNILHVL